MNATIDPRLQLAPPGSRATFWLFALCVLLPLLLGAAGIAAPLLAGSPMDLIGDSVATTLAVTVGGLSLFCAALWWVLSRFMHRQALQLTAGVLELTSSFYRCRMPVAELRLDQARVVDLDEHTELKPMLKTNGYSIPGFRSGWFLLRNRRRSFVAIADGRHKLWLPTRGKHDLLLEPRDPAALLTRLRELAAAGRAG